MNISTLSRRTGVSVRCLRYYETKGLLQSKRLDNGYRDFAKSAVDRVNTIQLYFGLGLNTDEIAMIIKCPVNMPNEQPLCEQAYELYKTRLSAVNKHIEILENIRKQLHQGIAKFEALERSGKHDS